MTLLSACCSRGRRDDGQLCRFPCRKATGDLRDGGESSSLQQAGGDGGTIAACAIYQQRAIFGEGLEIVREAAERKRDAAFDGALLVLSRGADVHSERRLCGGKQIGGVGSADALSHGDEFGSRFETLQAVREIANDVIEADAAEADGGFAFTAWAGDDDDGAVVMKHGAGPGGVLSDE